jgi:hypothetical protein
LDSVVAKIRFRKQALEPGVIAPSALAGSITGVFSEALRSQGGAFILGRGEQYVDIALQEGLSRAARAELF